MITESAIESEIIESSEVTQGKLKRFTEFSLKLLFVFAVVIYPLFFGGVHFNVYNTFQIFLFAVSALTAWNFGMPGGRAKNVMILLSLWLSYLLIDTLIRFLITVPHPVLGPISSLPAPHASVTALLELSSFIALFYLFTIGLQQLGLKKLLLRLGCLSGIVVSVVALSHWFYDNGKLFWLFTPENAFISNRARWPFVNANHLGHFALLLIGIVGATFCKELNSRNITLNAQSLSSKRGQKKIIKLGFLAALGISLIMTLLATLSRGSWLGFVVTVIILSLLTFKKRSPATKIRGRMHFKKKVAMMLPKLASVTLFIFGALLLLSLLQGKGQELVSERIEYGLLHSKDDMRWQLYSDSKKMFSDSPLYGFGLAQWNYVHAQYMDPKLSGVDPEYMHSDPLQIVIELGILGGAFTFFTFIVITWHLIKSVRNPFNLSKLLILFFLLAFFIASFLDFPLRVPSINAILALSLAFILSWSQDKTSGESSLN